jgi:hypothetical protein
MLACCELTDDMYWVQISIGKKLKALLDLPESQTIGYNVFVSSPPSLLPTRVPHKYCAYVLDTLTKYCP